MHMALTKFVLHGDDEDDGDDDESTTLHQPLHARASGHAYRKGSSVWAAYDYTFVDDLYCGFEQ